MSRNTQLNFFQSREEIIIKTLKNRAYQNNRHSIDELKDNIRAELGRITEEELLRVYQNFIKGCQECVNVNEEDRLPKFLCHLCLAKLECLHDFREMCHEAENMLNGYLLREGQECCIAPILECVDSSVDNELSEDCGLTEGPAPGASEFLDPLNLPIKTENEEVTNASNNYNVSEDILLDSCGVETAHGSLSIVDCNQILLKNLEEDISNNGSQVFRDQSTAKKEVELATSEFPVHRVSPFFISKHLFSKLSTMSSSKQSPKKKLKGLEMKSEAKPHVSSKHNKASSHQRNHPTANPRSAPYECSLCNKPILWRKNIARHLLSHGKGETLQTLSQPRKVTKHVKRASNSKTKSHIKMSQSSKLKSENNSKNKTQSSQKKKGPDVKCHEETHVCSKCNKSFPTEIFLTTHFKAHLKSAPFTCLLCGKKFLWRANLDRHLLLHSGTSVFSCPICNKEFSQVGNVKRHLQQVHPEAMLPQPHYPTGHLGSDKVGNTTCKKASIRNYRGKKATKRNDDCKASSSMHPRASTYAHNNKKYSRCPWCDKWYYHKNLHRHITTHKQ